MLVAPTVFSVSFPESLKNPLNPSLTPWEDWILEGLHIIHLEAESRVMISSSPPFPRHFPWSQSLHVENYLTLVRSIAVYSHTSTKMKLFLQRNELPLPQHSYPQTAVLLFKAVSIFYVVQSLRQCLLLTMLPMKSLLASERALCTVPCSLGTPQPEQWTTVHKWRQRCGWCRERSI